MSNQSIVSLLSEFISIQSVSADPSRFSSIIDASELLQKKLSSMGFVIQIIKASESVPPLIIAKKTVSAHAATIGIYGHYDVQPEDPVTEWKSNPFVLKKREGKFFGRGVADNKGHIVQNISAIEKLMNEGLLKNNIVFILEGEEEVGSVHFETLVRQVKHDLEGIDVFYVTDTGMHAKNIPQIFYALRGLLYGELSVKVGERDLHSGIYGNRVINPIQVLGELIASIKTLESGTIKIPDFYKDVRKIPHDELMLLQKSKRTDMEEQTEAQTYHLLRYDGVEASSLPKILPSFDPHGIVGGFTGVGSKTIIPKTASMKFSFRLVEHQNPDMIEKNVADFIRAHIPRGVKYEFKVHSKSAPFFTDIHNEYIQKTVSVLREVFKHDVICNRSGGSIPAAEVFQRLFDKPIILTGFTLPDDNIHSPNENFDENMFWKGIEALMKLYSV